MKNVWSVCGICMGYVWNLYGICVEYAWNNMEYESSMCDYARTHTLSEYIYMYMYRERERERVKQKDSAKRVGS